MAILEVRDLCTSFFVAQGELRALESVSFDVDVGETLAIVGESGCGKSLTALSIMRLVPDPPGRIVGGNVTLEGRNLLRLSRTEMEHVRGDRIAMIFQEPMTSLNPVMTVGDQIIETLRAHRAVTPAAARRRALELLDMVRISEPVRRLDDYPHRLSGGMRQRVMIAIALAPVIVLASVLVATAILTESALAFLGFTDPNVVSWGSIIGIGRSEIRTAWYISAVPGIVILFTVLALNQVNEGLNDALNPRLKDR